MFITVMSIGPSTHGKAAPLGGSTQQKTQKSLTNHVFFAACDNAQDHPSYLLFIYRLLSLLQRMRWYFVRPNGRELKTHEKLEVFADWRRGDSCVVLCRLTG
jgi:hypothetical protein